MKANWLRTRATRPATRIILAVILIMVGLAPIGVPILSDSSWRAAAAPEGQVTEPTVQQPEAFEYRTQVEGDTLTKVERSDDGGQTWYAVASIPEKVSEVQAVRGDEQVVYGLSDMAVWVSRDGAATWEHTAQLPSRPMALAVTSKATGTILVGTESVGLAISRDGGATWQVVNDSTLTMNGAAPIAVTALEINPADETIVYATTAVWTGTSTARLSPVGTFVSVDGGRLWLQMNQLPLDGGAASAINTVEGKPLAIVVETGKGAQAQELVMSPELIDELSSADPSVRASVARVLGLLGDQAAVQPLLDRLNDEDVLVGDRVAEALGRLGDASVAPALIDALSADEEAVRARAAHGLGLLKHEAATDLLAERLRVDRPMVARRAAEALASIGTPAALAALTVPLADNDMTPARHAAMAGLELAGKQATAPLVTALSSQNPALRTHAAEMLGWIKPDEAVDPLAAALEDANPAVRVQAAWALGEIASPEAQEALAVAEQQAGDEATKTAVLTAQQRAELIAFGDRPAPSFADGFLTELGEVPATSWTFFALFLVLALALLLFAPRTAPKRSLR